MSVSTCLYTRFIPLALAALLLSHVEAADVGAPTNVLTLADALRLADERNLSLRSAREDSSIARGRIQESRSAALPHLDLSAQYVRVDDVASFGDIQMGQKDNFEITADVSQILYAGGGVRAALRLANEYAGAAESKIADANQQMAFAVHARFNQFLLAQETVAVALQSERLAKRNDMDVTARVDQGMATRFDQLRADEQLSRAESQRIAAINAKLKARLALLQILELPLDDTRAIMGLLSATPVIDDSIPVDTALQQRPDIATAQRAVAVQREALAVARSGHRPTVGLFGQLKQANPDRSFDDEWENSWLVGVRAEVPLFDGLETRGKINQAEAALRRAQFEHDAAVSQARLEIAEANADIASAATLVDTCNRNVTQAREALRLAQRSYDEGVQQQIDVITAQTAFTDSGYQLAAAQFKYIMSCRRFQLVTGTLTVF